MLKTFTALAVLFAWPVVAQQCGPHENLEPVLSARYGEVLQWAVPVEGGLLQYYINDVTKSWTLALSKDETACILAAGSPGEPA